MLLRLRARDEAAVAVPVFDRDLEIARAGARLIPREVRIIVAEGNYLLLAEPPWDGLRPLFDVTAMIDVSEDILRARLTARWQGYGLSPAEIAAKVEGNDLPNGARVRRESAPADFVIGQDA
jgi:pantothenate kinase